MNERKPLKFNLGNKRIVEGYAGNRKNCCPHCSSEKFYSYGSGLDVSARCMECNKDWKIGGSSAYQNVPFEERQKMFEDIRNEQRESRMRLETDVYVNPDDYFRDMEIIQANRRGLQFKLFGEEF
jgi:hypothetical protein